MSPTAATLIDLAQIVGPGAVREAIDADAIDGIQPRVVVEPATPERLAAVLAWCNRERRPVVVRGGGTKLGWGRVPDAFDVVLSTRALRTMTRYEPGDLTVTVEAGMTVADLNTTLARHGQWLPMDVTAGSTIGGMIAANESGPLRHRYGAPRDVLIGVHIATADGRIASAGGNVVKNVAGYDLGRLMAGSFGSLAVIVSAAFKLSPVPATTGTLVLSFREREAVAAVAADIAGSQLDPLAMDVEAVAARGGAPAVYRLLVRMGGMAAPVDAQLASAAQLAAAWSPSEVTSLRGEEDVIRWANLAAPARAADAAVRLSWLPADLPKVLALVEDLAIGDLQDVSLRGRAALGAGTIWLTGSDDAIVAGIARLRAADTVIGNVVVMSASDAVKRAVDVWQVAPGTALVGRLLKQTLDPAGILNAHRGPI